MVKSSEASQAGVKDGSYLFAVTQAEGAGVFMRPPTMTSALTEATSQHMHVACRQCCRIEELYRIMEAVRNI